MEIKAKNLEGKLVAIDQGVLNDLRTKIRGPLIASTDPEYDEVRKIWNAMIDRRPALIIQCTGTADVIEAVLFAKKNRLIISVRGGGHNIAGRSIYDNVLLIDLTKMKSVLVDPDKGIAIVAPGATLADVDHETQEYGLALPVGINSTTGIAGLTLGGGFGWLSRKYGMTVDHLISAEVVTTEGKRLICDKDNHPDLFWAIRGGGGNFGIVTSFKFELSQVGPKITSGPVVFPMEDARNVLLKYRELCKTSPEELTVWAVLRNAPPFPFINAAIHGKPVLILAGIYNGPIDEGNKVLEKLKELGKPIGDHIVPGRFSDFQQAFDPLLIPGFRNYWKTHNFKELNDGFIDLLVSYGMKLPSPYTEIFIAQMGGATNRVPADATAYPHRDVEFIMNVHTRWENANQDENCLSWAREFYKATKPFATGGAYVNFVSEGDEDVHGVYAENVKRLESIKSKYDPDNVLRSNINITPSSLNRKQR